MSKSPRKVRDKWRAKTWYDVYSPYYFGEINIGSVPVDDPKGLYGRVVETTLYDITGDFGHQSVKLHFQIVDLKEQRAETILKGHEYAADYLRSLVRRGSSRIDGIFDLKSKDDFLARVSTVAFAHGRIRTAQDHAIRKIMNDLSIERAASLNYDQLCHEMVLGKIGSDIYNVAKKIVPLRHVGIRKSKLIKIPEVTATSPEPTQLT